MTLPTETWHQSARFVKVLASTQMDLLKFIKESIDTNATNWAVAGWSGNGVNPSWLILKRTGAEDNQRLTLFSVTAGPNASSLEPGVTPGAQYLYAYATLDRPLTTIDGSPASGDIFASSPAEDKFKGRIVSPGVTAGGAILTIYSTPSTLMLVIHAYGPLDTASVIFGKCLQLPGDDDHAALFTSSNIFNTPAALNTYPWFVTGTYDASPSGSFRKGGVKYNVGRLWDSVASNPTLMYGDGSGVLHDVSLVARVADTALAWEYVGRLRQMRYGPAVVDRSRIYSGASLIAYHACPPNSGAVQTGLYMDNVP